MATASGGFAVLVADPGAAAAAVTRGGSGGGGGVVEISWLGLGLAAALILVQGAVSARLGLGLHSQLLTAGVRCVVQLSLLGYILVPIFNYGHIWLVLAYAAFMVWISAVEAIGRPTRYYKGMFLNTLVIIAVCASSIMIYALLLIIGVKPWWSAQYLIPILGMVLGNTISGISVGLATVIEELSSGKDQIERLLAMGASRSEATADLLSRSVKLAMTPLLNQMSVVGLVSIPGMMTGQILSGSNPDQAARYQMVIMFLLGAASAAASVASVYAAVLHVVDGCHRLRPERLIQRTGKAGVNGFINNAASQVVKGVTWIVQRLCFCCFGDRHHHHHQQQQQQQDHACDGDSSSDPADLKTPLLAAAAAEEGRASVGNSSSSANVDSGSSSMQAAGQAQPLQGSAAAAGKGQVPSAPAPAAAAAAATAVAANAASGVGSSSSTAAVTDSAPEVATSGLLPPPQQQQQQQRQQQQQQQGKKKKKKGKAGGVQ